MKTLFTLSLLVFMGFFATAQTIDIVIEGKKHTVTVGEQYKYVNAKGDTVSYFVTGNEKTATPATTETSETQKADTKKSIEKLPIGQAKKSEETNTSALMGNAYRFNDKDFGADELLKTEKLSLTKVNDPVKTEYPSLEFVDNSVVAFCYNEEAKVYHGDYAEFDDVTKTIRVCEDGKWSESNNDLQMSLVLNNKRKRLAYHIDNVEAETLVMQKKSGSAVF